MSPSVAAGRSARPWRRRRSGGGCRPRCRCRRRRRARCGDCHSRACRSGRPAACFGRQRDVQRGRRRQACAVLQLGAAATTAAQAGPQNEGSSAARAACATNSGARTGAAAPRPSCCRPRTCRGRRGRPRSSRAGPYACSRFRGMWGCCCLHGGSRQRRPAGAGAGPSSEARWTVGGGCSGAALAAPAVAVSVMMQRLVVLALPDRCVVMTPAVTAVLIVLSHSALDAEQLSHATKPQRAGASGRLRRLQRQCSAHR